MHLTLDPAYPALGGDFFDTVDPADFPKAQLRFWNTRWAQAVGLGDLTDAGREAHFARFEPLPGWHEPPLALRYHGHQFRQYNPQIGDGRGFLFAQLRDGKNRLLDLGTKGSGQTPYSRTADGRLTLKGAVREILATEMLEALGVYTSKTFAVFETGEALHRHDEPSPARGAVLTRLQHSHLRFGMFQRAAYEQKPENVAALADYAITHFYPELDAREGEDRVAGLLEAIARSSARLTGEWMAAGFVHGVLNTDNLNVTGESFDYGPWRFLPYYEPGFTAAYFDETGLYAYARQPEAVFWALQQLAGALSLICGEEALIAALNAFPPAYRTEFQSAFLRRLGVEQQDADSDEALVRSALTFLRESQAPWEAFFFDHFCGREPQERDVYTGEVYQAFTDALADYDPVRPERLDHAYFKRETPVHMTIETMEAAWAPVHETDDWSALHALLDDIAEARAGYDLGRDRTGFLTGDKA
ncbi:YdiU family protein [Hyphobacterium sp. Y6023]|uniref:Protein nucleotidyltransferase YdiU n=2 Tax=Hyphobacterium marinum TaxID=3116574 RepID=A0ABU7LXL8_9PROT|nr:YdiU family protein [Hyphobacterium sp. Y6023]MEE2566293.1 YdiU family protein [Hyphobacterium sp. Y6023]